MKSQIQSYTFPEQQKLITLTFSFSKHPGPIDKFTVLKKKNTNIHFHFERGLILFHLQVFFYPSTKKRSSTVINQYICCRNSIRTCKRCTILGNRPTVRCKPLCEQFLSSYYVDSCKREIEEGKFLYMCVGGPYQSTVQREKNSFKTHILLTFTHLSIHTFAIEQTT